VSFAYSLRYKRFRKQQLINVLVQLVASGVPPYYYSHNFQVQYEKPDDLPEEKFAPEAGPLGWEWGVGLVFVTVYNISTDHRIKVLDMIIRG
jgi:hypothetical protein